MRIYTAQPTCGECAQTAAGTGQSVMGVGAKMADHDVSASSVALLINGEIVAMKERISELEGALLKLRISEASHKDSCRRLRKKLEMVARCSVCMQLKEDSDG